MSITCPKNFINSTSEGKNVKGHMLQLVEILFEGAFWIRWVLNAFAYLFRYIFFQVLGTATAVHYFSPCKTLILLVLPMTAPLHPGYSVMTNNHAASLLIFSEFVPPTCHTWHNIKACITVHKNNYTLINFQGFKVVHGYVDFTVIRHLRVLFIHMN